jgi:CBS domain-containing protein
MKASDIMTRDVVTIRSSATVAEAIKLMQERGWRSLIVDREDAQDAYGIITETDIACKVIAVGNDPDQVQVCEVMTKPCIVVNPDLSVENIARLFANNRLLRAPVIRDKLLGIVSISDILVKSQLGEHLHKKLPDRNLQELVQSARTAYTNDSFHSENSTADYWGVLEEKLADLLQKHGEKVLKTALEEYYAEFEELSDPEHLDNLCSG